MPDPIPRLGLGTYDMTDPEACASAVETAIETGYRHVDTAQGYDNEESVGEGLARAAVPRADLFVATKLSTRNLAYEDALRTGAASADRLGVDRIDLLYVHWPTRTYDPEGTLDALDELVDDGVVANVGLSNFTPSLLREARERLDAPVLAHQVEMHPLLPQAELHDLAVETDHWLVAYCPIARNQVAEVPELRAVAEKHDATPAQVSLAWLLEQDNVVPIPKAASREHIRENWAARDLDLDADDLARIDGIEERRRLVDPATAPWN
jgi:diketogulonate reductase-like aldo/keto reductase